MSGEFFRQSVNCQVWPPSLPDGTLNTNRTSLFWGHGISISWSGRPDSINNRNLDLMVSHFCTYHTSFSGSILVINTGRNNPSLQDLFKTVKPEVILEFLKAAALYRLL